MSLLSQNRTQQTCYQDFAAVPWLRSTDVNTVFVLISLVSLGRIPLTIITCIVLLTGEIYYKEKGPDGYLKTWSFANKVIALAIVLINVVVLALAILR